MRRTPISTKMRWIPVLAYAGLIFYLSSRAWPTPSMLPLGADKVVHVLMYAVLGFSLLWALRSTGLKYSRYAVLIAASIAALYGALDEFHQSFVPGRNASIYDFVADGIGSTAGAWAAARFARFLRKEYATASSKEQGRRYEC